MTTAEAVLYKTIEDLVLGYQESKEHGEDALKTAIQILDRHIEEQQKATKQPLWVEICEQHELEEKQWGPVLADLFRLIAARCQTLEVADWLEAEADLAEFQHE